MANDFDQRYLDVAGTSHDIEIGTGALALPVSAIKKPLENIEKELSSVDVQLVTANSMQEAIDSAIANKKKLRIPNGTYIFENGLIIDGLLEIEGSLNNVIFDFSAMTTGTAIKIGVLKAIDGLVMRGLKIVGNNNIDGIHLNSTENINLAITTSHFSDIRLENFRVGIKSSFIWCNQFDNIRCQGCSTPAIFGNQTNNNLYNRCSFVSFINGIVLTNCEGLLFNACEIANGGSGYALILFQSNITFMQPYIENIPKLAEIGSLSESYPSILQINGGIVTGEIRIGGARNGLEINRPRANELFVIKSMNLGNNYLYQPSVILGGFEENKKNIIKYEGTKAFSFSPSFGGQTVSHVLNANGYAEVTASQGILVSNAGLTIGKQYVLAYRIKSDVTINLRHGTMLGLAKQPTSDNYFETRYQPFVAAITDLRLEWNGLALIEHLSIVEGLYFE